MAVNLSSLGGAGWQFFDNNGNPLSGGKLYSYAAGTSTLAPTYTSVSGATANPNPIILNSAGRPPSQIWLDNHATYKFVLTTSTDVLLWTMDNIPGIQGANVAYVTSRTEMAALPNPGQGISVYLNEGGRSGWFRSVSGSPPVTDTLQGLYVVSNTAGYYFARDWNGTDARPEWFGAVIDSTANRAANVAALNACASICPVTMLSAGTYYTNAVWRISTSYRSVKGAGRDKSVISIDSATAHVLHVGGTLSSYYLERPRLQGFTLTRSVAATVPVDTNDDATQGHGLHMDMTSNAVVQEIDTSANLVGIYWANALSPLWQDSFDLMTGTGARCYSYMVDGTATGGIGFPSLIVFRAFDLRQSNAGSSALSRGLLVLGSYTDMQIDRVETAGVHNGLLCLGGGGNAHFNSHWHDAFKADGIKIDKTGASGGENITLVDCYCAPGVGATGQPITIVNGQNIQIIGAQITSFPGGGNGKIGVLFDTCINCTFSGMVVNHSTGVRLATCYGCSVEAGVVKFTGTGTDGIKVQGGYANRVAAQIIGVSGSVGFDTGVAIASSGGNEINVSCVLDSTVTNRVTIGGTPVATAGNAATANFILRPGAAFTTTAT